MQVRCDVHAHAHAHAHDGAQQMSREAHRWISQRYTVKPWIKRENITRLGFERPTIDEFADRETHLFPVWWGEGGVRPDAFEENWNFDPVG